MIPQRVTLENFLCFGERTEIVFSDDEPLWVLGGRNGVGKSAVFDAMTFCLFGQHRGAANAVAPLLRHGATGFAVAFEFTLSGTDYRIARNRTGTRSTQSAESRAGPGEDWRRVPNVETGDQIKAWSEATLGIGFEAFKASILLRQGEAEAMVSGKPQDRLKVLKKVIGAERYEALSLRVHEAAMGKKREKAEAVAEREATPAVTAEVVAAAEAVEAAAAAERVRGAAAEAVAAGAVDQADRWATLTGKRDEVRAKLTAALDRFADADRVRADKARHDELARTLPVLTQLPALRETVTMRSATVAELRSACDTDAARRVELTASHDAGRAESVRLAEFVAVHGLASAGSRRLVAQQTKFRGFALDAERFAAECDTFPADLDDALARYVADVDAADAGERAAGTSATQAHTLLAQCAEAAADFSRVAVGVSCSQCGQRVDADHADRERQRLAAKLDELTRFGAAADQALAAAADCLRAAGTGHQQAATRCAARNKARRDRDAKRLTLAELDCAATAAELEVSLAELEVSGAAAERDGATAGRDLAALNQRTAMLAAEQRVVTTRLERAVPRLAAEVAELHKTESRLAALVEQLPADAPIVTTDEVAALVREQAELTAGRVAERFAQLLADDAVRGEWESQAAALAAEADAIPPAGRVSVADARRTLATLHAAGVAADGDWQLARDRLHECRRHFAAWTRLTARVRTLEVEADRHTKLDELLGKNGLQRDLVRTAEKAIVRMASETLGKLSDGDLSVELDPAEAADDKAFALLARRAGVETPIAVAYLSGSQKFRVAIAVALAIGRYATNQSHPLECVIIDEGFGSLDRDGLRATAEELNLLKMHLKRIILVSHQDEFTDQFPVVIQLTAGENGTTARAVRR